MQTYIEDSCIRVKASPKAETEFERAVTREQFSLRYQPWIDPRGGRAEGIEALLSWRHPVLGDIPQSRFMPTAKAMGFADVIVEQLLHETCGHGQGWLDAGLSSLHLAVNVPAENVASSEFVFLVAQCLDDSGLAPENLDLVLALRDALAHADRIVESMHALRELGVSLTIANVDSANACMGLVKLFPANRIKLDDYLVRRLSVDPSASSVAETIVNLAHAKEMLVIAEQVDTAAQASRLADDLHCDLLQGSHYGQALAAGECLELLRSDGVQPREPAGRPEEKRFHFPAVWGRIICGHSA
ncbi:MAG TPA: EAL domain-containing protein [Noviherbaspirillum sp.]|nr:EAL domain-containing protein [Noviherbaspirillum sp.]